MAKESREMKRININVPLDTLTKIDEYADRMTINRTAAILVLVNLSLDSQKAMNTLDDLMKMVKEEKGRELINESE